MNAIDLSSIHAEVLDATTKGCPLSAAPLPLSSVGAQGWSVLAGDLPLAVIRASGLAQNRDWMRDFSAIAAMNDRQAYLRWHTDRADPPQVGDLIGCGISHPCTTFDKWQVLFTVDDGYRVTGAIRTFF